MSTSPWGEKVDRSKSALTTTTSVGDSTHTYTNDEKTAFADWINTSLKGDPDLADLLPVNSEDDSLFKVVHNGLVMCKLINDAVPNTIDERAINKTKLNAYRIGENQTLVLNSSRSIGCNVINISATDLMEGIPHLVLGLLWQVIKIGLLSKVNLKACPELFRLLNEGETQESFLKLSPDQILLRWVNYHLANSGSNKRVQNFSSDIKDSEAYTLLLNQVAPKEAGVNMSPMNESDKTKRAEKMLQEADKIKCRKFLLPRDVVNGNAKLNLAFVANLFNTYPGLEPVEEVPEEIVEETREEKTYRNWMNSMGVSPYVSHLYEGCRDGIVLLQLLDKIRPGIVDWKAVNQPPFKDRGGNMKQIENCNYAVKLALDSKFSLVGIEGKDIYDCNKTANLAFVWQAMRAYTLGILTKLSDSGSPISDSAIIAWANGILSSEHKISGWKDPKITTSLPIAHLVEHLRSGTVDFSLLSSSDSYEDKVNNAKYVITCARKVGACVFTLPEQVVESDAKMILTLFAALMTVAYKK
ncbi:fimbrin-like [Schistocerca gregaria]|uniref:fimbrin-like n=1 Tax=Schistocerca gregaria TaxID=7010 RepID=UPI00211F0DF0|nr:fimbrin-like [Schistocerca gregaria]